jgi:hypothetical protein
MALWIGLVLIVAFGFDPSVSVARRGLIADPIEHFGYFKHATLLLIVQSFSLAVCVNDILFFLHPLSLNPLPNLPLVALFQHVLLLIPLPKVSVRFGKQFAYGLLIDLVRELVEGLEFELLPASLVLDLLLVVLQDVAHVTLTHVMHLALLLRRVPKGHL